jgi:hypothetical protein
MRPAFLMIAPILLTACAAPEPPVPYVSEKARAALPKGTDLRTVRRRDDGCYLIVIEGELSGVVRKVVDRDGRLVCDEI